MVIDVHVHDIYVYIVSELSKLHDCGVASNCIHRLPCYQLGLPGAALVPFL